MVITIIALVVGGILVGKSLIRNAELQSVISDADRYRQAAKLFKDKYRYLPGDFPEAERFWGAMTGCPDPPPSAERRKATCNGDGDGFIGANGSGPAIIYGSTQQQREPLRVWQHLANGGFIDGQYSGTGSPSADGGIEVGASIPAGRISLSGYTMHYAQWVPAGGAGGFTGTYGHIVVFGRASGYYDANHGQVLGLSVWQPSFLPILESAEAQQIDSRVDDGRPGTGNVRAYAPGEGSESPDCATSDNPATAEYKTDQSTYVGNSFGEKSAITCSLIFVTGF